MLNRLKDPRFLIAKLSTKLVVRGFPVSPDDNRKALEVLSNLPRDASPDVVGRALAGVYSRSEEMYRVFLDIWRSLVGGGGRQEAAEGGGIFRSEEGGTFSRELAREVTSRVLTRISREGLVPISTEALLRWKHA